MYTSLHGNKEPLGMDTDVHGVNDGLTDEKVTSAQIKQVKKN